MKKLMALVAALAFAPQAFSFGVGMSTYPLMSDKKLVSTEMTGITSTGGGVGLIGRYSQKINNSLLIDAGAGISAGDRANKIFVGADYEIFPDYMNQPRFSLKTTLTNADEFGDRRNILSISPILSKGFSFWGEEAFPFISIPVGLSLESGSKTYETVAAVSVGIAGNVPLNGYRHLLANIEATVNLKDSYSGVLMGVTFPLER